MWGDALVCRSKLSARVRADGMRVWGAGSCLGRGELSRKVPGGRSPRDDPSRVDLGAPCLISVWALGGEV